MKQWQETAEILARLEDIRSRGEHAAIACVVDISGSAYRRPGARFLIATDGSTLGGISGGCLEEDVRRNGLSAIDDGKCRLLHYETGEDDDPLWGLGLGCNGAVDVFVMPTSRPGFDAAAKEIQVKLGGELPFTVATTLDDGDVAPQGNMHVDATLSVDIAAGSSRVADSAAGRVFVDVFRPPPALVVCGAGDDAMAIVAAAANVGFRVVVVDHRPGYLTEERFPAAWRLIRTLPEDATDDIPTTPDTFVLLKTHNIDRDKAWARHFGARPIAYLGLLGPRARCEEVAAEAVELDSHCIFGPVGVDIGAEGPEQIGVAVVAELLAVRTARNAGHLRDRDAPIHDAN